MTTGKRARKRADGERGVALVEFALVLPFVAVVVFGVVDLGRAYTLQNRLRNAAREGARFAQFQPEQVQAGASCPDPNNIAYAANHEEGTHTYTVVAQRWNGTAWVNLTGCKTPQDPTHTVQAGDRVRVRVSSSFTVLTPLISAFVNNPITATGSDEIVVQG